MVLLVIGLDFFQTNFRHSKEKKRRQILIQQEQKDKIKGPARTNNMEHRCQRLKRRRKKKEETAEAGGESGRIRTETGGPLLLLRLHLHKTFISTNLDPELEAGPLDEPASISLVSLAARWNYTAQLLIKICRPSPNTRHGERLDRGPQTNVCVCVGGGGRDSRRLRKRNVLIRAEDDHLL